MNERKKAIMQAEGMRNIGMSFGGDGLSAHMTEEQKARRKARLDETRQLKGRFKDYLTEVDVSQECAVLSNEWRDWPVRYFKWHTKTSGIDTDQFRQDCKEIDNGSS